MIRSEVDRDPGGHDVRLDHGVIPAAIAVGITLDSGRNLAESDVGRTAVGFRPVGRQARAEGTRTAAASMREWAVAHESRINMHLEYRFRIVLIFCVPVRTAVAVVCRRRWN